MAAVRSPNDSAKATLMATTTTPKPVPRPKAAASTSGQAGAKAMPTAPAASRGGPRRGDRGGRGRWSSPQQFLPAMPPAKWALRASAAPAPPTPKAARSSGRAGPYSDSSSPAAAASSSTPTTVPTRSGELIR